MKFLSMILIALFGVSAFATPTVKTYCGTLEKKRVMCIRAPCPPIVSFTYSSRYGIRETIRIQTNGEQAAKFISSASTGEQKICAKGFIAKDESGKFIVTKHIAPADKK